MRKTIGQADLASTISEPRRNLPAASGVDTGVNDGAAISIRADACEAALPTASEPPTAERPAEVGTTRRGHGLSSPTELGERLLVERARSDRRAFAPLYLAHYGPILGHIFRRVGDAHAAQDIAAETFIRAMNGLAKYQQRGLSFRHWLLRIASNEVNRHLQRAARRRRHERGAWREGTGAPVGVETSEHVQRALLRLSADHQTVLALHYFEGLSVEEIARVVGCRAGTVKSRLGRARTALGALLTGEDGCNPEGVS